MMTSPTHMGSLPFGTITTPAGTTASMVHGTRLRSGLRTPQRSVRGVAAASPEHLPTKAALVDRLMQAKEDSGKTYTQIADECGLSNVYTAMLLQHQQQLKPQTAAALKKALPGISDADIKALQKAPSRRWDPTQLQDPVIYRLHEATMLAGEAIKGIINEEFDDGIMSAINFHVHVDKAVGKEGEERVVISMNGKFLPYVEQKIEDDVTRK